jgi:hypothetical protein
MVENVAVSRSKASIADPGGEPTARYANDGVAS